MFESRRNNLRFFAAFTAAVLFWNATALPAFTQEPPTTSAKTDSHQPTTTPGEFADILSPKNSSAFSSRGSVRYRVGDLKGAMQDFDKAIELDDKNAEAFSGRGYLKLNQTDNQGALADFDRAIAVDPKNTAAFCGRGQVYSELGKETEAQADFDHAIELDPKNAPSYIFRGFHLGRYGDNERAIADYDQTIRLDPNNALAFCYRASALQAIKDNKGAIADFDAVIKFDPQYAWAYYWRGHNREQVGDRKAAIDDFTQYIRLKPDDPWGFRGRGFSKFQSGNPKAAVQDYTKAIALDKTDPWTFSARGFVRGKLGDTKGSIADYRQAQKLEKAKASEEAANSATETKSGDTADATTEQTVALISDPDVYDFSEKTLREARQLFGKPKTEIKQLLIFHRPGPHCQTVLWDNDKGIFCIFMANEVNDSYFKGNLGHELVHLLNAKLCDPYVEGLCTVFGEERIPESDEKRNAYRELVLATPFYAETYNMMKEIESAIDKKSFGSMMNFAAFDQGKQWMHIEIDKWLDSISEPERDAARQIISKYADAIDRTMPKDGTYVFNRPATEPKQLAPGVYAIPLSLPKSLEPRRAEFEADLIEAQKRLRTFAEKNGWAHLTERPFMHKAAIYDAKVDYDNHLYEIEPSLCGQSIPATYTAAIEKNMFFAVSPEICDSVFPQGREKDSYIKLILHELAHRLHVRLLKHDEERMGPVWFYEGFAIYAADQYEAVAPKLTESEITEIVNATKRGSYLQYRTVFYRFLAKHSLADLIKHAGDKDFTDWLTTPGR